MCALCITYSVHATRCQSWHKIAIETPPYFHRLHTMSPQSNRPTGKDLQLRKMCVGIVVNPWAGYKTHDAVIPPHSHEVLLGDCDRLSRCPVNCSLTFQLHVWVSYTLPAQRLEQMTSCKAFKEYDFHKSLVSNTCLLCDELITMTMLLAHYSSHLSVLCVQGRKQCVVRPWTQPSRIKPFSVIKPHQCGLIEFKKIMWSYLCFLSWGFVNTVPNR